MLKQVFTNLLSNHTNDQSLINEYWKELDKHYSDKKRHYHNLSHLENIYGQLLEVKAELKSWETILWTMFYHDIIYNSLNSDNEEKSAQLAEKRMKHLNVPISVIENCQLQILATKKHLENAESDTNYFIDADLSILGSDAETYALYYQNIRKEYSIYPNIIYNAGRKKVLKHFLEMERIFKTEIFYNKFEIKAKDNLLSEFKSL